MTARGRSAIRRQALISRVLPPEAKVPFVFLKTEANELWGQFSPDGRWVAYQSTETGRYEISVRPFSTHDGAIPISTAGGVYPRWSPDGKELYFIGPDAKMRAASTVGCRAMPSGATGHSR